MFWTYLMVALMIDQRFHSHKELLVSLQAKSMKRYMKTIVVLSCLQQ